MVIAQRLVRRLARTADRKQGSIRTCRARFGRGNFAGSLQAAIVVITVLRARGHFEVLAIDNSLRRYCQRAGTEVIEASARQAGLISLFEHGCMAVEQGMTTLEELVRVLGMPDGC